MVMTTRYLTISQDGELIESDSAVPPERTE